MREGVTVRSHFGPTCDQLFLEIDSPASPRTRALDRWRWRAERKGTASSKRGSSKAGGNEGSWADVVDADSSVSKQTVAANTESRETRARADAAAAERRMQEFGLSEEVEAALRSGSPALRYSFERL